jgi:putative ABC transport system permease protein
MISKATFIQVGSFFILPLLLAVIHSVTGIRFVKGIMAMYDLGKISWGIGFASVIIALIYGGYFIVTYNMSKKLR